MPIASTRPARCSRPTRGTQRKVVALLHLAPPADSDEAVEQHSAAVAPKHVPGFSIQTRKKMKILRQLRRAMWNLVIPTPLETLLSIARTMGWFDTTP